jgi:hypothetical protein
MGAVRGQSRFNQGLICGRQRRVVQFQSPADELLSFSRCHPGKLFYDLGKTHGPNLIPIGPDFTNFFRVFRGFRGTRWEMGCGAIGLR